MLGEQGYETSGWPLVVQRIEVPGVAQKLGTPVLPLVLRMDPELPNGFVRAWKPYYGLSADRHRGYAFQWFALATALLVIYVVLNTKRRPDARGLSRMLRLLNARRLDDNASMGDKPRSVRTDERSWPWRVHAWLRLVVAAHATTALQ